jgi:uncharacterized protein (DUF1501 family)
MSRRDFLKVGGLGVGSLGLPLPALGSDPGSGDDRAVILLLLVGGPSQLDTFDPKPDAPSEVRGPFGSIPTSVPGVRVSEFLPRLARRMDRVALLRSLHHDAAPIHETGHQLLQTGRLCRLGEEHPHVGSVVAQARGARDGCPPSVILPGPIGNTGVRISHGQTAGPLDSAFAPYLPDGEIPHAIAHAVDLSAVPGDVRDAYGRSAFGRNCLIARRLVEAGARVVTVNMHQTVFHRVSWDCHGAPPFSTLDDYRRTLLPAFDAAFSALLDDLARTGRLDTTLVVATGEFGRTPRLNASGGRDHWPGVWSAVLAGGGVRGGQVIGASDATASEPVDRPVTPPELLATVYQGLGIDPASPLPAASGTGRTALVDARPVGEAFA